MKKKKLLHRIFVVPSFIVLFSLLAVFILFQIISDQYVKALTSDALKNEMDNIGSVTFFAESDDEDVEDTALIVPVMHLVIDAGGNLVSPTPPWYYDYEVRTASALAGIIADSPDAYKDSHHKLNVNDNFYLVQAGDYKGFIENGVFVPDNETARTTMYSFISISPLCKSS